MLECALHAWVNRMHGTEESMGLHFEKLLKGGHLVTMKEGRYNTIEDGALGIADGKIAWIGAQAELPPHEADEVHDLGGRWVTPGFVDCHTHLVFGGDRGNEFEQRLEGVSYEEIARQGGGILSTVRHTRKEDQASLEASATARLAHLLAEGVTTIEIKSGYGLSVDDELKMLRAARAIGASQPVRVCTTFLGAHALHPDYQGDRARYVDLVANEMLSRVAEEQLADATDAFCENIAFNLDEVRTIFEASKKLGIPVKLHADQLTDGGGAALAASFSALSADHVEYTSEPGIAALGEAGTVAVLLPGAWYTLREEKLPEIALMRKHGVSMALATDCNPGSSPVLSLQTMISMACTSFRMTPEEALAGVTIYGAKALGFADQIGSLETGKAADLAVWDIASPAAFAYWLGSLRPHMVIYNGELR